jgi:hypothetical protein
MKRRLLRLQLVNPARQALNHLRVRETVNNPLEPFNPFIDLGTLLAHAG